MSVGVCEEREEKSERKERHREGRREREKFESIIISELQQLLESYDAAKSVQNN